jgi:uncharacterized protein (TIGR02145 family)
VCERLIARWNLPENYIMKSLTTLLSFCIILIIVLQFPESCKKAGNPEPAPPVDGDGNAYTPIKIGSQEWLVENLRTTRFNDGTAIPIVYDQWEWDGLTTPARCWYNNDGQYQSVYGGLYNWYAVRTNKLCPLGWHIPNEDEWNWLFSNFGGMGVAGGHLKDTGTVNWVCPNVGADNSSGFTALPGGYRSGIPVEPYFTNLGHIGHFWINSASALNIEIHHDKTYIGDNGYGVDFGHSVRCIRDR